MWKAYVVNTTSWNLLYLLPTYPCSLLSCQIILYKIYSSQTWLLLIPVYHILPQHSAWSSISSGKHSLNSAGILFVRLILLEDLVIFTTKDNNVFHTVSCQDMQRSRTVEQSKERFEVWNKYFREWERKLAKISENVWLPRIRDSDWLN